MEINHRRPTAAWQHQPLTSSPRSDLLIDFFKLVYFSSFGEDFFFFVFYFILFPSYSAYFSTHFTGHRLSLSLTHQFSQPPSIYGSLPFASKNINPSIDTKSPHVGIETKPRNVNGIKSKNNTHSSNVASSALSGLIVWMFLIFFLFFSLFCFSLSYSLNSLLLAVCVRNTYLLIWTSRLPVIWWTARGHGAKRTSVKRVSNLFIFYT